MNKEAKEILNNIKKQNEWNGIEYFKTSLSNKDAEKLLDYINQLETNRDEAIEYIKHSWRLKFDQVYDTSKYLSGWEAEELLSILERGKE